MRIQIGDPSKGNSMDTSDIIRMIKERMAKERVESGEGNNGPTLEKLKQQFKQSQDALEKNGMSGSAFKELNEQIKGMKKKSRDKIAASFKENIESLETRERISRERMMSNKKRFKRVSRRGGAVRRRGMI